jgi:hypothetical protein
MIIGPPLRFKLTRTTTGNQSFKDATETKQTGLPSAAVVIDDHAQCAVLHTCLSPVWILRYNVALEILRVWQISAMEFCLLL